MIASLSLSTIEAKAKNNNKKTTHKKIVCKNMSNCAEAMKYLKKGYKKLDRDRDGIPCEKLCK